MNAGQEDWHHHPLQGSQQYLSINEALTRQTSTCSTLVTRKWLRKKSNLHQCWSDYLTKERECESNSTSPLSSHAKKKQSTASSLPAPTIQTTSSSLATNNISRHLTRQPGKLYHQSQGQPAINLHIIMSMRAHRSKGLE